MILGSKERQIEVNMTRREVLFQALRNKFEAGTGFALATINLDHLSKLPKDDLFLDAYRRHDLVIADGRPVVWLSKLAKKPLELIPGSDLIVPLCSLCAEKNVPVAFVGSSQAALDGAAEALIKRSPTLKVVYTHAPAFGFTPDGPEAEAILKQLAASGARMCFIALGAPKQECFAAYGRQIAPDVGFVSIGAGLDFLSGHQIRAPKAMQALAMEWLWRLMQDPKRMVPRYLRCIAVLPQLFMQAWSQRKSS